MTHEHDNFEAHTDGFIVDEDGREMLSVGHMHGHEGMSVDEIRHRLADEKGDDPAKFIVFDPATGKPSLPPAEKSAGDQRSRSFGFSKWGAKWEPTGPKGNPNLN